MHLAMQKPRAAIALVALAMTPLAFAAPCDGGCAGKTALKCAIDGLAAHEWCEFSTPPTHANMTTCSPSNPHITTESDTAFWDPVRNQVRFIGSPHGGSDKILTYDEATNTWTGVDSINYPPTNQCNGTSSGCTTSPNVSGVRASTGFPCTPSHGYDHNTGDPMRGEWFVGTFNSEIVNRSVNGTTWTELPSVYCQNVATVPIVYFPERDGLFRHCQGNVASTMKFWSRATNTWSDLDETGCTLSSGSQTIYQWAEYDSVNQLIWFGARESGSNTCTFKADGTFDQEAAQIHPMGPVGALVAHDPARGGFIVMNECAFLSIPAGCQSGSTCRTGPPDTQRWRFYDPISETWSNITWSMPPILLDEPMANSGSCALDNIEATIAEYNAIMYITHGGGGVGNPKVYLYRHSDSTPATLPAPPTGVRPV